MSKDRANPRPQLSPEPQNLDIPESTALRPAAKAPTEAFIRALKDAINPGSSSSGRELPSWNSLPPVNVMTEKRQPHENSQPTASFSFTRFEHEAGESLADVHAVRSEFGDLLATEASSVRDETPSESEDQSIYRPRHVVEAAPPKGQGAAVEGDVLRPIAREFSRPDAYAADKPEAIKMLASGSDRPESHDLSDWERIPLKLLDHDAPTSAAVNEKEPSDSTPRGDVVSLSARRETSAQPLDFQTVSTSAGSMNFARDLTQPASRRGNESSDSLVHAESSAATSAFGPILSSAGASGLGRESALAFAEGRENPGQSLRNTEDFNRNSLSGVDHSGGSLNDLTKTNELLQQLLDEFRKAPQSFLPTNNRNTSSF